MAETIGEAFVRVRPDTSEFPKELEKHVDGALKQTEQQARKGSDKIGGAFSGLGPLIAGGLAGAGIEQFVKESVKQASDLGESINAIGVILGDVAGKKFNEFGKSAATSLGLTQSELNTALVPVASLLGNAGLSGDQLASSLENLATRATDVGSVFNADVNDVLDAFGAALRGETEPARRFGVNVSEAGLKAEALSLGLVKATGDTQKIQAAQIAATTAQNAYNEAVKTHGTASSEASLAAQKLQLAQEKLASATHGTIPDLDEQQKRQAALALVMDQTSKSAGDFQRTMGESLPNQLKVAAASMQEVQAAAGAALLPILAQLLKAVQPLLEPLKEILTKTFQALGPVILTVGKAFTDLLVAVAPLLPVIGNLLNTLLAPLAEILGKQAQVLTPLIKLVADFANRITTGLNVALDKLLPVLLQVMDQIGVALLQALKEIEPQLPQLVRAFADLALSMADLLIAILPLLPILVELLVKVFLPTTILQITLTAKVLSLLAEAIAAVAGFISRFSIRNFLRSLQELSDTVRAAIIGTFHTALDFLKSLPGRAVDALADLGATLLQVIGGAFSTAKDGVFAGVGAIVRAVVDLPFQLLAAAIALPGQIVDLLTAGFHLAADIVPKILTGIVDFIFNLPGRIFDAGKAIFNTVKSVVLGGFDFIRDEVPRIFQGIVDFVFNLPGRIIDAGKGLFDAGKDLIGRFFSGFLNVGGVVLDFAKRIVNAVIGFINSNVIGEINKNIHKLAHENPILGFLGGFSIPKIPELQSGGLVRTGGLALLHPAEVVTPAKDVGPAISFEAGSIVVELNGGGSAQQARQAGKAVGDGILDALARRDVRLTVRTA